MFAAASIAGLIVVGASSEVFDEGRLPTRPEVANALMYAMTCRDEDGFTNCDVPVPVEIRFDRLRCSRRSARVESIGAYVTCRFTGRALWRDHFGAGAARWRPLSDQGRFIDLVYVGSRWQAIQEVYLAEVPGD